MASIASLLIIALSVSLDGFGVGMLYAVRGIRIPNGSLLVIAGCSGALLFAAMLAGDWLSLRMTPHAASAAGAAILVAVGLWSVIQFFRSQGVRPEDDRPDVPDRRTDAGVVGILRSPVAADRDRSGNISASEAALLGIALSLDAVGAGVGAALIGYRAVVTAISIAAASGLFVRLGTVLGRRMAGRFTRRLAVLPGFLLIGAGLMKLLQL